MDWPVEPLLDQFHEVWIPKAVETELNNIPDAEREGRTMARQLGLSVTGVLGVLLRAKKKGYIKALKPEITALKTKARFFIAPALEAAILLKAEE